MPKSTFNKLNDEKKRILLQCAKEEFGKNLYEDVSINKIIHKARISRGSFYMYFEDKKDLYLYLVENHEKYLMNLYINSLKESNGDYVKAFLNLYNKLIMNISKVNELPFIKNIYLNMKLSSEKIKLFNPIKKEKKSFQIEVLKNIDKNLYKYTDDDDIICSFELLMILTDASLVKIFLNNKKEEERKRYEKTIDILSHGIYREEI